jgi:hypothetical protein
MARLAPPVLIPIRRPALSAIGLPAGRPVGCLALDPARLSLPDALDHSIGLFVLARGTQFAEPLTDSFGTHSIRRVG